MGRKHRSILRLHLSFRECLVLRPLAFCFGRDGRPFDGRAEAVPSPQRQAGSLRRLAGSGERERVDAAGSRRKEHGPNCCDHQDTRTRGF